AREPIVGAHRITDLDTDIFPLDITKVAKSVAKGFEQARLKVLGKHTNPMHRRCLLRYTGLWPQHRHRGNKFDDLPSPHSITSSARASSDWGTVRSSALAVFRLMTSSYFVGACTGRSAAFPPLRMRST